MSWPATILLFTSRSTSSPTRRVIEPERRADPAGRHVARAVGRVLVEQRVAAREQVEVLVEVGRALADGEADVAGQRLREHEPQERVDLGQVDVVRSPRGRRRSSTARAGRSRSRRRWRWSRSSRRSRRCRSCSRRPRRRRRGPASRCARRRPSRDSCSARRRRASGPRRGAGSVPAVCRSQDLGQVDRRSRRSPSCRTRAARPRRRPPCRR